MSDVKHESWLRTERGVTWIGTIVDSCLSACKILVGVLFSSQTILADGLHSLSDLITDIAVLAGLRVAKKPADSDHPYGHYRVTTLVAMFVGAALMGAATYIIYSAIKTLHEPHNTISATIPFFAALISIPAKEILFRITRTVGTQKNNVSLIANAWHHRTDAFTSIAAAAGLGVVALGGEEWVFLDHITAIVLSAFLLIVALRIIYESSSELIDQAPSEKTIIMAKEIIASTEGVISFHAIRARKLGGKVEMDIHIQVHPDLTVREGHDIATIVKKRVMESELDVVELLVHIEPAVD